MGFCDLRVLVRKLACPFGHPTQVSTQVQLAATYDYLRVRLARALDGTAFQSKWCFMILAGKPARTVVRDFWMVNFCFFLSFSTPRVQPFTVRCASVKSAYEPSGSSDRGLSRFPWHEAIRSISNPPWTGCVSIAGLLPSIKFVGIHFYTWVERGTVRGKCVRFSKVPVTELARHPICRSFKKSRVCSDLYWSPFCFLS